MSQWEYEKLNLSDVPRRGDDVDLLNDAGEKGWELVAVTANNMAYLKRPLLPAKRPTSRSAKADERSVT
jgi:hypothetical protein